MHRIGCKENLNILGGMRVRKTMKHSKILTLILCLVLLLTPVTTMASSYYEAPDIYLDGYYVYTDMPPITVDGRTLIPIRAITEALGCIIEWYPEYQCIDIYTPYGEWLMTMYVNDYYAYVNYGNGYVQEVYMGAAAQIYNGRVMVPLRFVAESLGLDVYYDYYSGDIYIYSY